MLIGVRVCVCASVRSTFVRGLCEVCAWFTCCPCAPCILHPCVFCRVVCACVFVYITACVCSWSCAISLQECNSLRDCCWYRLWGHPTSLRNLIVGPLFLACEISLTHPPTHHFAAVISFSLETGSCGRDTQSLDTWRFVLAQIPVAFL